MGVFWVCKYDYKHNNLTGLYLMSLFSLQNQGVCARGIARFEIHIFLQGTTL